MAPPPAAPSAAATVRRGWDDALIAGLLALLAGWASWTGATWRLDHLVYDLALASAPATSPPDVVIVAIDDTSLAAIGRWPWRRAIHAALLDRLAEARPRAIALDLVLAEPDADPRQDAILAAAIGRAAPVALPLGWRLDETGRLLPLAPNLSLPRGAAQLGSSEATVDADGVLRSVFLQAGPADELRPHLALALLEAGGEPVPAPPVEAASEAAASTAPLPGGWARDARLGVRFTGPPGTVERLSYVDVLAGAVPAERLRDRYVLVGVTAQGLGDQFATPVGGTDGAMPGIEVLAQVLHTLRTGGAIVDAAPALRAAVSAALVLLLVAGYRRRSPRAALLLTGLLIAAALMASVAALRLHGPWLSPVPLTLAALLAYPVWSWRRLERIVGQLDAEIGRLAAEPPEAVDDTPAAASREAAVGGDLLDTRLQRLQQAGGLVRAARRSPADTLAGLPTAMLLADTAGRVRLANPRAAALFEVETADELVGLDLPRLLAEFRSEPPQDWPAALGALRDGVPGLVAELVREVDGLPAQTLLLHAEAVRLQDTLRWVVTLADIAAVKAAERQRDEALAFVSHDLRSPAGSIAMLAELNRDGRMQTPLPQLLAQIERLARQTLALSDDFVRAAHVQTQPLDRRPVVPAELIEAVQADALPGATAAGIELCARIDPAAPTASLDLRLLQRALGNLIGNAIRHSSAGSRLDLTAGTSVDGRLQLAVRDHGPGLDAAALAAIERGDALMSGHGTPVGGRASSVGVGLGLSFVQRVARRHGGRLHAETPDDGAGGVRFVLELPAAGATPPSSGNP